MTNATDNKESSRVISVGGGKGGVGKSIVASNLAIALARTGRKVVLVDLDLGAANQHLLLGVEAGRSGITALLEGTAWEVEEALAPTGVPNLSLLQGSSGTLGAANIPHQSKLRLLRKLRSLDATVVLDVGAGVGYNALDFFLLGTQKILVVTPQVTSIHDAYAFLKGAILRLVQQHAEGAIDRAYLEPALESGETAKVGELLARLHEQRPDLGQRVARLLKSFGACLVGNQLHRPGEITILASVSRMMGDYLGVEVPVLGWLPASEAVRESINARRPVMLGAACKETRAVGQIVDALLAEDVTGELDLDIVEVEAPPVVAAPRAVLRAMPTVATVRVGLPNRKITLPGMTPLRTATPGR